MQTNKIYQGDCIEIMADFPDDSVDIIIADPPYNLSKGGNWAIKNESKPKGFGGEWSKVMSSWDNMSLFDYFNFSMAWLEQCKRILKPTGSIWVHGTYHNIGIINMCMQLLEIEIINEVIWYKRNSFPNLSGTRLTASHETILWAHTGSSKKRKYNFNYEFSKSIEYKEDLLKQKDKQMRTVWDIPNNKKKDELKFGKHPTQKPIRLIRRMLDLTSLPDDIMLAPFSGSGTECVAAKQLGLNYIGIELDEEYVKLSKEKIENEEWRLL